MCLPCCGTKRNDTNCQMPLKRPLTVIICEFEMCEKREWLTFYEIPEQVRDDVVRNDGRLFYGFLDALDDVGDIISHAGTGRKAHSDFEEVDLNIVGVSGHLRAIKHSVAKV